MTQPEMGGVHRRPPQQIVLDQLNGMWLSYALQAAARYNLATLLGDESKTTAELARQTETQENWVYRLLRFLAANGVFAEVAPRTFVNTDLSTCLRSDIPGSMYAMARMMGSERSRKTWGQLEASIKTGIPAVEQLYGVKLYDYFEHHVEEEAIFEGAMTGFSGIVNKAIATSYDFSRVRRLVDVGGGNGSLLSVIHSHYPTIRGVLFDRPTVIARVRENGPDNLPFELSAGDFFEEVLSGADMYVLKEVLHNWSDEQCRVILQNCRRVMDSSAVLLVCEQVVLPENNQGAFAKGLDLLMGLEQQGGERTQEEFRALFESAGFRLTKVIPTRSPQWIFEGVVA